ncbi:MAG: hypothetical protein VKO65_02535 [Cyanobacteriota bacterium]|nr:hypothetical protein [Cyanobacteriota bacterium]
MASTSIHRQIHNLLAASNPMNTTATSESGMSAGDSRPWAKKLATVSASLTMLALAPPDAKSAVVKVSGQPVSLSLQSANVDALWDIDGQGTADFRLQRNNRSYMYFQSVGLQGLGVVGYRAGGQNAPVLARLYANQAVGSSRTFVPADEPIFGSYGMSVLGTFSQFVAYLGGQLSNGFSAIEDNYFGFRFDLNGNIHYGYGIMQFDLPNYMVTISSWAYESTPGQAITIGDSPSSAVPAPIGLAGLAAGAAWTRGLRRRIRESA